MTVAAILKHKGNDIVAVGPGTTIAELARLLAARRIGAVIVQDGGKHLLGIISERDIVVGIATHGAAALVMPAERLMTRAVTTVTPRTTVPEAMALMTAGRFRHLPVVLQDEVIGIVSIGDIVKARMMTQEGEVETLRAYVAGTA